MTVPRTIDAAGYAPLGEDFAPGPAPMLQWIRIVELVVDEAYQRPIVGAGRTNVRRIAERFRWSMFAPVIVAPVEGGRYAIIDGQHRATAAALRGIEAVPCQVVIADIQSQAQAFRAINGQVTKISALSLHRAGVAAGDPAAAELAAVARDGGIRILPYPKAQADLAPGETLALGSIQRALREFDRVVVVTALRCITATGNNRPGIARASIIRALVTTLGANARWCFGGGASACRFRDHQPGGGAGGSDRHATPQGRVRGRGPVRPPDRTPAANLRSGDGRMRTVDV